ncbi:MAG: FAD-binding oxidoreductase [Deltaproteobacteria bacterium]|nr:MAG: FAD-binding oxidoreductase [Deltaproteobacteria bacterium]
MSPKYRVPEEYKEVDITERGWFYDWCTIENLEGALQELRKVVGEEWATNDPTIMNNYSRDESTVKQVRPHIVALPSSTEEVSGVLQVAAKRNIPVTVGSCRINQAGECIPRRGGIILDLVRMDKILELDEEGMYITVQPFVTWADLQIEGEKLGYWEGRALYGCMPEAPASASVLGNTLGYGLSFHNVWYGFGPNRVVSMTSVLSDGTIVKLGSESIPNAGKIGGAQGPGMMLAQMHCMMRGKLGIVTELTVEIFPWGKYRRFYSFSTTEKNFFGHIDWWYKTMRLDLFSMFIADAEPATCIAQIMTPTYQEAEQVLAMMEAMDLHPTCVWIGIVSADTQKELDAKCRMIEKLSEETEGAPTLADASNTLGVISPEMFLGRIGGMAQFTRKTRNTINYMRQRETEWYSASWIQPGNIPRYYETLLNAGRQHLGERNPWAEKDNKSHFRDEDTEMYMCAYFGGRVIIFERDYCQANSSPYEFYKSRGFVEQASYGQYQKGMTGGWRYAKRGSVWEKVENMIKDVFDPKNILNPDYDGLIEDMVYGGKAY